MRSEGVGPDVRHAAPPSDGPDPTIGILAGMGPRSTSPFLEAVLDECVRQYGAVADDDFPPIMIYSVPTPFRLDGRTDHTGLRQAIRRGLDRLLATGPCVVAIPCNVAHFYFDELVRDVAVPVLNLIETTIAQVPTEAERVVVLGTPMVLESGLYRDALAERGVTVIDRPEYREAANRLIRGVKAGWTSDRLAASWERAVGRSLDDDVDCLILGSTDLSAIPAARQEESLHVVDSSASLAASLVARWRECVSTHGAR